MSNLEILAILALHFIGDFVGQTDEMAKNKSKSNKWLLAHLLVYTAVLLPYNPVWALINGVLHLMVDWVTSRWSSRLYAKGDIHNFFVVIGFDQLIHASCLLVFSFEIMKYLGV